MSIYLLEHNRTAYEAVLEELAESGKAAVVHPTGTGKSFIGFQLCEDNPKATVCWLSPSEYIFHTQLENLSKTSDGYVPENIVFYTYARLRLMSREEITRIHPDYIVLDEFHRCGAQMWGKGIQALREVYPDIPILGLSATNIRYLDNQRDMAAELFDGHIASEMTLGEAVVRGIIYAPKYVLSIFSYQKDMKKYETRVKRVKNRAVRDKAGRYLEELRRALEKADGLEDVFYKHMERKTGKYIVFCSNREHMKEMMRHTQWFAKVDTAPHLYSVYTGDPSASQSFEQFKRDNDSEHLKLLYCIDALNEGIHLESISGVILLRPTVSPIIYKQQIGRALSAGQKNHTTIFDIVLNIENLYSIGAVEEEMAVAVTHYHSLGENDAIVNEHFQVIDEVRDCRKLFEKLNDMLTVSWDVMFQKAERYFEENGDLLVPARYVTPDGYSLGRWIVHQRNKRRGAINASLSREQVARLDSIGMAWETVADLSWARNLEEATRYFEKNGNLNVPAKYVTAGGVALGAWLASLRTWKRSGTHSNYLTKERIEQLNAIGMIWNMHDFYWENNFSAACAYYREHHHLDVPNGYVTRDGVRLGGWIWRLRYLSEGSCRGTPLTGDQIRRLNEIGMIWMKKTDLKWNLGYQAAAAYVKEYGNLSVPVQYKTKEGFLLGSWIQRQRRTYRQGKLSESRRRMLASIGMVWDTQPWLTRYVLVKKYYDEHGTVDIPQSYTAEGIWLGKWLAAQKKKFDAGGLSEEQRALFAALPRCGTADKSEAWYRLYNDAAEYCRQHGNLKVPSNYKGKSGCSLGDWIIRQRRARKNGKLTVRQIALLDHIGFVWAPDTIWEKGYRRAKEYFEKNGHLGVPKAYRCGDGYALGTWVSQYRKAYNGLNASVLITVEQIGALEEIGMRWTRDTAENGPLEKVAG